MTNRQALNYYDIAVESGTTMSSIMKSYTTIEANSDQPGLNFVDNVGWAIGDSPFYGIGGSDDIYAIIAISLSHFTSFNPTPNTCQRDPSHAYPQNTTLLPIHCLGR